MRRKAMAVNAANTHECILLASFQALLVITVSILGFLCNVVSFLVIVRHHAFNNSFGYITAYHAFSNASILLIFAVWATPWTLFSVPDSIHGVNAFFGQMTLFFVEVSFHCSLLLSLNRFTAIAFPLKYRIWFADRTTLWMLSFITLIAGLYWGTYFIESCEFIFDHTSRVWTFGPQTCSVFMAFYVDMVYNVCIFVIVVIIDLMSLTKLRKTKKYSIRSYVTQKFLGQRGNGLAAARESKREKRREMLLFLQAFSTSGCYSFMLVCFHVISTQMSSNFAYFLCTTLAWELSHTLGGVILICFNPEIRRHLIGVGHFIRFLRDGSTNTAAVCPVSTVFSSSHK